MINEKKSLELAAAYRFPFLLTLGVGLYIVFQQGICEKVLNKTIAPFEIKIFDRVSDLPRKKYLLYVRKGC